MIAKENIRKSTGLRMTDAELIAVQAAAVSMGMTRGQFIRKAALDAAASGFSDVPGTAAQLAELTRRLDVLASLIESQTTATQTRQTDYSGGIALLMADTAPVRPTEPINPYGIPKPTGRTVAERRAELRTTIQIMRNQCTSPTPNKAIADALNDAHIYRSDYIGKPVNQGKGVAFNAADAEPLPVEKWTAKHIKGLLSRMKVERILQEREQQQSQ